MTGGDANDGQVFDRLPATADEREVAGRATRAEVVQWWEDRFGVPTETFDDYTFWEKGKGKVWIFHADLETPVDVEGLGLTFLRTRQEHWKPTTDAVQRFGRGATTNVVELSREQAIRFARGEAQELDWDGDWGYLIVAHDVVGDPEPIGVGLYLHGELRSQIPKGRQEDLS
jgi:NOL1/NOP2/fmu family ribosome biogenesis protein